MLHVIAKAPEGLGTLPLTLTCCMCLHIPLSVEILHTFAEPQMKAVYVIAKATEGPWSSSHIAGECL